MIGERLKNARESKGIKTVKELAQKTGVSEATISKIENNLQDPKATTLNLLGEILNINLNWLITGKGEMFVSFENGNSILKSNVKIIKVKKGEQYLIETEE